LKRTDSAAFGAIFGVNGEMLEAKHSFPENRELPT
jgi:hypothetical protein